MSETVVEQTAIEQTAQVAISQPVWDVVYLVSCAVDGTPPNAKRVADMDLNAVFRVAQRHLLASACATALDAAGVRDERFVQAWGKAVRKVAAMDAERAELFRRMDAVGIWHMPLKGCVLQALYPSYGTRQMADNDILFDATRADDVRKIMTEMGFSTEYFDRGPHDVYHKEPVCNFELHRALFGAAHERVVHEYYQDVERLLQPDEDGSYGVHFSDEEFYVYLVAHEHKHFAGGGTGMRSLLDTFVWLRAKGLGMDWEHVLRELDALGLSDFEQENRELALNLFSGAPLSPANLEMLAYIVDSGTYGTMAHNLANQIARYGRAGYLLRRTFPSFAQMTSLYPVLGRVPMLLPACWAWRLASALVTKPRKVARQLRAAFW